MKRITDFRIGQLRIPADKFPLPERVEEMLRLYAGPGVWDGDVAVFEIPVYRIDELEAAMAQEMAKNEE